jgi:hypothetical protein
MAITRVNFEDADIRFAGKVDVAGATAIVGILTLTGASGTFGGTAIKVTADCANTTAAGIAWTSGVPVFSAGQAYMTLTAGATKFRIPLWLDA